MSNGESPKPAIAPLRVRVRKALQNSLYQSKRFLIKTFRSRLALLKWEIEAQNRYWMNLIERAKGEADKEALYSEWRHEMQWDEEEVEILKSSEILRQAAKLDIEPPARPREDSEDENWDRSWITRRWFLKPRGRFQMRQQIRAEFQARRKERQERLEFTLGWALKLIAGLAALIGMLTGLVSVWKE